MNNVISTGTLFHRSKARIKDLGEVFTPESYVEDMLTLLSKDKRALWSDENIAFFEMSCGHGNIVVPIYRKRLEAIYKKALGAGIRAAAHYAVANAINTLWAIDIDAKNVSQCRSRVLAATFDFFKSKLELDSEYTIIGKKSDFFAHLLCAINWHISENEALSALSNIDAAAANANQTRSGAKWFSKNGHQPIDFDLSWISYFENCKKAKTAVADYERAVRFINTCVLGNVKTAGDFEFAKYLLNLEPSAVGRLRQTKDLAIEA